MKSIFKRKKNRDEGVPDLTINRISKKADIVLNICFSVWTLACVLPLLLVVIVSFSSEQSIFENGYSFFPSEWSLAAYEFFFKLGDQLTPILWDHDLRDCSRNAVQPGDQCKFCICAQP